MLMQKLLPKRMSGFSLVEVLIAIIIFAFGLLGLASLQNKLQSAQFESYQAAQAFVLLSDMANRIQLRGTQASSYVTGSPLGTGDSPPDCTTLAVGPARDQCEWSTALQGAAETQGSGKYGAMIGARGCIVEIQPPNPAAGVCTHGIYQVTVTWQGITSAAAPASACAAGLYSPDDRYRRAVSSQVVVGLPSCQ